MNVHKLPSTFEYWFRTNYTRNIKILDYRSTCFNASLTTSNTSSQPTLGLNLQSFFFDINFVLHKNKWSKIQIQQNQTQFRLYINGLLKFDSKTFVNLYESIHNDEDCDISYQNQILSYNKSKSFFLSMYYI